MGGGAAELIGEAQAGDPLDRLTYYRGGLHDWVTLAMPTTVVEPLPPRSGCNHGGVWAVSGGGSPDHLGRRRALDPKGMLPGEVAS